MDNGFRVVGVFLEVGLEHVGHGLADGCADLCVAEFGLGLALELRFRNLHTDNSGQAFAEVVSADVKLQLVQHAAAVGVLFQGVGQPPTETCKVRTALVGVDVVDVREEILRERVVVSHGDLHRHAIALAADVDHVMDDRFAVAVEVGHKVLQSFRAVEGFADKVAFLVGVTLVG